MFDVKGKRAIVTGSGQGIGKAMARKLLSLGCKVCMCDVIEDVGRAAKEELQKEFGLGEDR